MPALLSPAFPFVQVTIDLSKVATTAQRSSGVVAVVGAAADDVAAAKNTPVEVTDSASVREAFGKANSSNTLTKSLELVLAQDPRPSKVYGVRTDGGDYAAALVGLEAADDVTFVSLANESEVGESGDDDTPPTKLMALSDHVKRMSADGARRIGVAMLPPATPKSPTYVPDALTAAAGLKSDAGRMILIAARGATYDPQKPDATADAASAAMGAIAGYAPSVSAVLKQVRGFFMPVTSQYSPSEITRLSREGIIPLIDPALIPGTGLYFADGGTWSSNGKLKYIDIVRVLDDVEFRLRAGLIGSAGDSRITKAGLTQIRLRTEGILGPLRSAAEIDDYAVSIHLLDILSLPPSARTPDEGNAVATARDTRQVSMRVQITLGPQVHQLTVTLAPTF